MTDRKFASFGSLHAAPMRAIIFCASLATLYLGSLMPAASALTDFGATMRLECLAATKPERTISACISALHEPMPSEARPEVILKLARAYAELKETGPALQAYDAVAHLDPQNFEALAIGCWIRALSNVELENALRECNLALAQDPGDAQILEFRCLVNLRMSNYPNAIADCSAAAQYPPTAPRALYFRGVAKLKAGDAAGGKADIASAQRLKQDIANDFAEYSLTP
jgi:tetratricopeptide (TPR) repeat protein